MNHYFSRLAQRSGITAPNPARQSPAVNAHAAHVAHTNGKVMSANHENSVDVWGEQNIEISSADQVQTNPENIDQATRATAPRNSNDQFPTGAPVNTRAIVPATAEINATASSLQPTRAQPQSLAADVHYDAVDELVGVATNSVSTGHYPELKTDLSLPGLSTANRMAAMQRDESARFSGKHSDTGHRQHISVSAEPHSKTVITEAVQRRSNTVVTDNNNTQGLYGRGVIEEHQNKKTSAQPESETPSISVAPPNRAGRAVSNAVAATPAETPTALINRPDAPPRSGVQVNIGKIELEIFAPQKKIVPASPAPVAPAIAPVQREPVFNLHRHYLRSR